MKLFKKLRFLLILSIILVIWVGFFKIIPEFINNTADIINDIVLKMCLSYISSFIFYYITIFSQEKEILKIINSKIKDIIKDSLQIKQNIKLGGNSNIEQLNQNSIILNSMYDNIDNSENNLETIEDFVHCLCKIQPTDKPISRVIGTLKINGRLKEINEQGDENWLEYLQLKTNNISEKIIEILNTTKNLDGEIKVILTNLKWCNLIKSNFKTTELNLCEYSNELYHFFELITALETYIK